MEEKGLALELLSDYKKANKRQFIIILVLILMWSLTIGYLIYTLNDIGTVETTTTQEIQQDSENGNNNFIGNDGDIINGKANDKTNKDN